MIDEIIISDCYGRSDFEIASLMLSKINEIILNLNGILDGQNTQQKPQTRRVSSSTSTTLKKGTKKKRTTNKTS